MLCIDAAPESQEELTVNGMALSSVPSTVHCDCVRTLQRRCHSRRFARCQARVSAWIAAPAAPDVTHAARIGGHRP
eukprot:349850-Chlamydomonas_euryale.AAC.2